MKRAARFAVGVDGVVDIETQAWDRFVLGAILDSSGRYRSTRDPERLALWICQSRGDLWAHNGGHYDALWFLSVLDKWRTPDVRIALAGSRVTCVSVADVRLRDSYALVPMSLAQGAELGGSAKLATGFPCSCGKDCGGYCRIRVGMPARDFRTLDAYLEADCRATLAMLRAVAGWCEERGVPMRGTIGGTAWADVRQRLGIKPARWIGGTYEVARRGYYGGRVEVFRPRAVSGYRYDRNSSYPAALVETSLPVGRPAVCGAADAARRFGSGAEGIFQAEVEVPADLFVPPLPMRLSDRLVYPVGRFEGVWTALHLRRAMERGVRIRRVGYGLVWPTSEPILRPWCEWVWKERANATGAWNKWVKLLANSLTGKLAQRPDHESAILGIPAKVRCPGGKCSGHHPHNRCCDHRCVGRCGCWHPIGPSGRIWGRTEWRYPSSGHVQWAAYLTASAEIELDRQLCEAGDGACYCDTDSVYSIGPIERKIGADLGEWKLEGEFRDWHALAPKLYRYLDPAALRDVVRGKGMSKLDSQGFDRLAHGGAHVVDTGVRSFLSAARGGAGLFVRSELTRTAHGDGERFGGRRLAADGRTYALPAWSFALDSDDTGMVSEDD